MKKLSILTTLLLFSIMLVAQAPANDNCGDATPVLNGDIVDFSTIDATTDGPFHPGCISNINDTIFSDIWYSFTPDFDGFADWSMCGSADFDTKIAIYQSGASCPLTDADLLVCNDDFGNCAGSTSRIVFEVTDGNTYLLRLGGWGETAPGLQGTGTFTINEFMSVLDNDLCQQAQTVMLGEGQQFTSIGATTDGPSHPGNTACFGFNDDSVQSDIWYTFTAPSTNTVEWRTCDQINFDSRLAVYNAGATCPVFDGDLYACNDDGSGCGNYTSRVIFEVTEGETYLLRLGGWNGATGQGVFDLIEIIPPVPPANDLCANPDDAWIVTEEQANDFDSPVVGTTINGTFDADNFIYPNNQCFAGFNTTSGEFSTVWYKFNNNGNEELEMRLFKSSGSEESSFFIELFESCDMLVDTNAIGGSCIYVDDETSSGTSFISGLSPDPTEYYIRVVTRVTTQLTGDFFFFLIGAPPSAAVEAFPGTFEVFPNPVNGALNLQLYLAESTNTSLRIFNTLGQNISSQSPGQLPSGQHTFQFDTGEMSKGIYFLAIQSEAGTSVVKFVKE